MNGCMEKSDAMLSSPAWRFRMLHIAHRNATDSLLDKYKSDRSHVVL